MTTVRKQSDRPRAVSGLGLLAMAIIAGATNFGIIQELFVRGDRAATVAKVAGQGSRLWWAAVGFGVVAVLDVIVALALLVVFRNAHQRLATTAAVLRIAYVVPLSIGTLFLVRAAATSDLDKRSQYLSSFDQWWSDGLAIFGLSLLALGAAAWQSRRPQRIISALIIISGFGYVVDAVLRRLDQSFEVSTVTFVGEVVLMGWLLVTARGARTELPAWRASG
jgi:Domain of unknown function (DUF4386)